MQYGQKVSELMDGHIFMVNMLSMFLNMVEETILLSVQRGM